MKTAGIYKITSPSNKIYIGQSWDINRRRREYNSVSCSGQRMLYNSIKKYGLRNHEFKIIYSLPFDSSQNVMDVYETFCISQFKEAGFKLLNATDGGGGSKGFKHSDEVKARMKIMAKKRGVTKEAIHNLHLSNVGRICSPDKKEKIRQALLGRKHTPERVAKIKANRKMTPDVRQKISKSLKAYNRKANDSIGKLF